MAIPSIAMIPSGYEAQKVYSVLPTNGDGDLTFARASSATRVNQSGLIETVLTGVARLDYTNGGCPSLLLEPAQTQLYGETETMATQTKTVTAVAHTVSFNGTGTITFTGVYAGSLVGTGVNNRVELTFTPTAGSLVSTVSGSVTKSQLVTGSYLGSYIPNITTGQVTRVADAASKTGLSSYINSSEGVLYAEISALNNNGGTDRLISISDGTINNRVTIGLNNAVNRATAQVVVGGVLQVSDTFINIVQSDNNKITLKYKLNDFSVFLNGVKVLSDSSGLVFPNGVLNSISFDRGNGTLPFLGNTKDLRVYTTALTDSELTTLTTL